MSPTDAEEIDEVFDAFGHHLRRECIRYLEGQQEERTPISELVEHIERREPTTDTERVELRLHHSHLPTLEALGWLEYEAERGQIIYYGDERAEQILSDMTEMLDS